MSLGRYGRLRATKGYYGLLRHVDQDVPSLILQFQAGLEDFVAGGS